MFVFYNIYIYIILLLITFIFMFTDNNNFLVQDSTVLIYFALNNNFFLQFVLYIILSLIKMFHIVIININISWKMI